MSEPVKKAQRFGYGICYPGAPYCDPSILEKEWLEKVKDYEEDVARVKAKGGDTKKVKKPKTRKPAVARKTKRASTSARTPVTEGEPKAKGVRPGSKLEIVVGLLTRKEGCTTAEILAQCQWPSVSVPQQARAAGLRLRQEKDGKVTRYWGS